MRRDKNRINRSAVLLLASVGASYSMAVEIDDVHITRKGRVYRAQLTFDVTASVDQVASVLTDYEHPNRLTPDVTGREIVSRRSGVTRVRTEIHSCVVFFCKDLTLTQDVTVVAGAIKADIVPEESDFRSGYLLWSVTSGDRGGSHIQYDSVIEPDFYIPPLIGRFFIRKRLRQ
ncbi:MAG: SRPBCC family protein, partial [Gammaproteobacteria bacterium]